MLWIRDVYPGSRILIFNHPGSQIPDPKTATKERGENNYLSYLSFNKIENYFIFETLKKKIWANCWRIKELFAQKIVTKLLKIWVWDPGSRKNLFWIPDPGVKKAPDPRSAILVPAQTDTRRRVPACLCQNTRTKKPVPNAFGPSYVRWDPTMRF